MAINHVNTDVYRSVTTGQGSWTINAGTTGDLRVIGTVVHSATINVSTVSGGGVTTWTRAGSVFTASSNRRLEIWYGTITGSGTSVTFTYSSAIGSTTVRNNVQDFRDTNGSTMFQVQDDGSQNNASGTTYTMPQLTSINAGELYFGHGHVGNTATAGSTTGFTYTIDANGNPRCYHPNLAAATNYQPTGPHSAASTSHFIAAIFAAVNPDTDAPAGTASATAVANAPSKSLKPTGGAPSGVATASAPLPGVGARAVHMI